MSDDDDTGHHHSKIQAIKETGDKPVTLKLWVVAAIAVAAFALGAWIF